MDISLRLIRVWVKILNPQMKGLILNLTNFCKWIGTPISTPNPVERSAWELQERMTNLPIGDSDVAALTAAAEEPPWVFYGCDVFDIGGIPPKLPFSEDHDD